MSTFPNVFACSNNNTVNRSVLSSHAAATAGRVPAECLPTTMSSTGGAGAATTAATTVTTSETEDLSQLHFLRCRMREHMHTVIQSLATEDTQAYMEAVQRDCDLVKTETDPLQFLRYCDYEIWEAAKRLCLYWTERKRLFGSDRAFLPLVLTGTGALTKEDMFTLRAGFPSLLPDTKTGQKCLLVDRTKKVPHVSIESLLRVFFYIGKILAEESLSQIDGAICLLVVMTPRTTKQMGEMNEERFAVASLMAQIFPIRPRVHLLAIPSQKRKVFTSQFANGVVQILQRHFSSWLGQRGNLSLHVQTEPNEILNDLIELGLTIKGIPLSLGGEWRFEDFFMWCQERMEWEHEHYKERLLRNRIVVVGADGDDQRITNIATTNWRRISNSAMTGASPSAVGATRKKTKRQKRNGREVSEEARRLPEEEEEEEVDEQERLAKRRMADVLRSRRKRERKRVEMITLTEESFRLRQVNHQLKKEHCRLEGLMATAQEYLAGFGLTTTASYARIRLPSGLPSSS